VDMDGIWTFSKAWWLENILHGRNNVSGNFPKIKGKVVELSDLQRHGKHNSFPETQY